MMEIKLNKPLAALASIATVLTMASVAPASLRVEAEKAPSLTKEVQKRVTNVAKATVFKTNEKVKLSPKEFECLAKNVYHEAGVEPTEGKIAVAQVTLNRVKDGKWGNDVCKVVYAKSQFSWTLDKKKRVSKPAGELWQASVNAVKEFQKGIRVRGLGDSTFYHADYIRQPKWAKVYEMTAQVGKHIFYKG